MLFIRGIFTGILTCKAVGEITGKFMEKVSRCLSRFWKGGTESAKCFPFCPVAVPRRFRAASGGFVAFFAYDQDLIGPFRSGHLGGFVLFCLFEWVPHFKAVCAPAELSCDATGSRREVSLKPAGAWCTDNKPGFMMMKPEIKTWLDSFKNDMHSFSFSFFFSFACYQSFTLNVPVVLWSTWSLCWRRVTSSINWRCGYVWKIYSCFILPGGSPSPSRYPLTR